MTDGRDSRLGSFLLGGILGGLAGLAAAGRLRSRQRASVPPTPPGLAAFEEAPCFQERLDEGRDERLERDRRG